MGDIPETWAYSAGRFWLESMDSIKQFMELLFKSFIFVSLVELADEVAVVFQGGLNKGERCTAEVLTLFLLSHATWVGNVIDDIRLTILPM